VTTSAEKKHQETLDALAASPHATVKPVATQAWLLAGKKGVAAVKSALGR
jgi:hypothetical protein